MNYSEKLFKKNCIDCGNEIYATEKQKLCVTCRSKRRKECYLPVERKVICRRCREVMYTEVCKGKKTKGVIECNHLCDKCLKTISEMKKIERNVICRECGSLLFKEIIRNGPGVLLERKGKLCSYCKEKVAAQNIKKSAQRWRDYNSFIKQHPESKKKMNDESRKKLSESMKQNNPMKNIEVIKKVKETLKKRIESGETKYKKGKDHWLFKGNRKFGANCRTALYECWVLPIMIRDNFHCTKCNSNKNLQVHHITPLRGIISFVLVKNNIKNPDALQKTDYYLYQNLIQQVINEHKLADGITLCKDCHIEIDERYRVKHT